MISTIKNEEKSIRGFLDSLVSQTRKPQEIIITDGGSSDNTVKIIESDYIPKYPYIQLIREHCNIARGRNLAIQKTKSPLIAVTDAGCRLKQDWLEKLIAPLEQDSSIDITGGITIPDAHNSFEKVVGGYFGANPAEIEKNILLISSRNIAFRKSIWEKVGGYPEWLYLTGEDTLFNHKLQKINAKIQIVPEAIVYWKVPRNFQKLFVQAYKYARGNGETALYKWMIIKMDLIYLLFLGLIVAGFFNFIFWFLFGLLMVSYYGYSGLKLSIRLKESKLFFWGVMVKIVIDMANLCGYPVGIYLQLVNKK